VRRPRAVARGGQLGTDEQIDFGQAAGTRVELPWAMLGVGTNSDRAEPWMPAFRSGTAGKRG
jgi:hypothetical protein